MADPPAPSLWSRLRADKPLHDEALTTASAGVGRDGREALFGVDSRSDLHLLLPINGGSDHDKPPDLQGLRVRHRVIAGDIHCLDLTASAAHERLFSPLAAEVLTAVIEQGRDPWKAVTAIIRSWQSAWKPVIAPMSKAAQVGVFGELLTLKTIMIPALGPGSIHHWSGPDSERHDFVGTEIHLEVKTTRKSRHEHEISRIDQLNAPPGRKLIVVSIMLEESSAGAESVASIMDEIIDLIRLDPAASDVFLAKMVQVGWSEELRRSGQLLRFHVRGAHIYEVDEVFPRFPSEFSPPDGVVGVKYTIDLANIPFLGVDDAIRIVQDGGLGSD